MKEKEVKKQEPKYNDAQNARWEHMYELIIEFLALYGRLPTEGDPLYKGENLANWRRDQLCRRKSLSPERYEKLADIGLFGATKEGKWYRHFTLLTQFIAAHRRVPAKREEYEGCAIGAWYGKQKQLIKNGSYPKERKLLLFSIPEVAANIPHVETGEGASVER